MPTSTGEPRDDESPREPGDSAAGEPAAGAPVAEDPGAGESVTGEPVTGEPATGRPATGRPEYGEYATPQEQAAAIARSLPPPRPAEPSARAAGISSPPRHPAAEGRGPAEASARPASARQTSGQPRSAGPAAGAVDRFVTILLLALGLVYLLEGIPAYLAFGDALQTVFTQWGMGDYTPTPATGPIGIALLVTQSILWLATAALAFLRLRRRRSSWWIAVLGAVASFLVTAILFATVLVSDPAFTTYLGSV